MIEDVCFDVESSCYTLARCSIIPGEARIVLEEGLVRGWQGLAGPSESLGNLIHI